MKISHYKIVRENDEYSLYIYLDPSLEEFAGEPNPITKHGYQLTQQIKALIKKKFPKLNIRSTKVMAGSIFIATLSLNPAAFGTKAKAA